MRVYPGIRVGLSADYLPLKVPLTVDVTTGDKITPREVEYSFQLMFDERSISVLAYNLETIMAEKLETILSRNEANTRPRDFYDIYILQKLRGAECDPAVLKQALEQTVTKRNTLDVLSRHKIILDQIKSSTRLLDFWHRYQREFSYADDISYDDICQTIEEILDKVV
ncbi:MAG: nucleotidyl transferase AbiEii/AbiGii toxin family protein [Desulfitobacteriaceae bacterium]